MDTKNGGSLKTSQITEWTFNQGGYLPLVFGGFLILGCVLAYIVAVLRGNVDPFLPLISDAAGSPPQNGLFGTLVCIGGMLGVFFMFLRYLIVLEQNQENSKPLASLNKISLIIGIASMSGITLITGYPANFYRDRDVWLSHVGVPHMIGGVMLFALGLIYIAIQCILTLYLRSKNVQMLFLRICLCLAATAAFVYHVVTVPGHFEAINMANRTILGTSEANTSMTQLPLRDFRLHIDTSGSYVPSAISQWILLLLFCSFFFTFFGECQEYSLLIVFQTSDPEVDVNGEVAAEDCGSKDGPSTYTRKTSHAYGNYPSGVNSADENRKASDVPHVRKDSSSQTKEIFQRVDSQLKDESNTAKEKNFSTTEELPVLPKSKKAENVETSKVNGLKEESVLNELSSSVANGSAAAEDKVTLTSEKANDGV